jgi:PadR family transcriptional regulator PadR
VKSISKELVAASSTMMILSILSAEESYGYSILQTVKITTEGGWKWTDGMIYPVLHRLEKEKLIKSRWVESETGRKRKYYTITDKGIKSLQKEKEEWQFVDATLHKLWGVRTCNQFSLC